MSESHDPVTREEFHALIQRVRVLEDLARAGGKLRPFDEGHVVPQAPPRTADTNVDPPPDAPPTEPISVIGSGTGSAPLSPVKSNSNAAPLSPNRAAPSDLSSLNWERVIGTQWLSRIGSLFIVIAMGFFMSLAFDRGWIDPPVRIGIGIAVGVLFAWAGEIAQNRRLSSYAHALAAVGVAVAYLSVYAGSSLYHLYGDTTTVALLLLVSTAGTVLALRYDAQPLAVMAAIGAYLGPVLVSGGRSSGPGFTFLNYMAAVSAGLAALSFYKGWRGVQALAFLAAWGMTWRTLTELGTARPPTALGYATLYYGIFLIASISLRYRRTGEDRDRADLLLLLGNPALYFSLVYSVIHSRNSPHQIWLTALAFGLAALYAALLELPQKREDDLLTGSSTALAVGFLTTGFVLGMPQWATLAWCMEALVLLWWGMKSRNPLLQAAARFVMGGAVLRHLFIDLERFPVHVPTPFLNPRFLTLACVSGTLLAFGVIQKRFADREVSSSAVFAWGGAVLLLGLGVVMETPLYASLIWMALALLWLTGTEKEEVTPVRHVFFMFMLVAVVVRVLAVDIAGYAVAPDTLAFFNLRFTMLLLLGVFLGAAGSLLTDKGIDPHREGVNEEVRFSHLLMLGANLCLLYGLSSDVLLLVDRLLDASSPGAESARQFALSALWGLYASAVIAWGFVRRATAARYAGLGLMGVVIAKVLLIDLADVGTFWRIASFMGVGALLLLISLAYHKLLNPTPEANTGP